MTLQEFKIELLPLKNRLFGFAMRLLNNREEAEDVVQEVYLKVWEMRNGFDKYKNKHAVLMTMTRNRCLDILKSKKYSDTSLAAGYKLANGDDVYKTTEQKDMVEKINRIMNLLPEQQKTVLQLRDIEGMEYDEITGITGFDANYVRVNLSRARKKVKELMQKMVSYEMG